MKYKWGRNNVYNKHINCNQMFGPWIWINTHIIMVNDDNDDDMHETVSAHA